MSILVLGDSTPTFPTEFQRRLQAFDKDLLLTFHRPPHWPRSRRGVWKVEQCIEHHGPVTHDHTCRRIYVLIAQDEDGTPMPLGDWVFEKLREMRANSESYGGETPRGLQNFREASARLDRELAENRVRDGAEVTRLNSRDHRMQLNRAYNLIEQHDMRPNK